jgi:cytochrome c oxidase subunit 2
MRRRTFMLSAVAIAAGAESFAAEQDGEVRISAKKFEFHPTEVRLKLGRQAILVITSEDRIHGFKVPDLGLRAEIVPGHEARLAVTPDKVGRFTFFCDAFCGEGHDDMEGALVVEA